MPYLPVFPPKWKVKVREAVFTPGTGTTFDPFTVDGKKILVTRCFDDSCMSGPKNGIWEINILDGGKTKERKLDRIPYSWGAQAVKALGIFIYTDGNDILAIPLRDSGMTHQDIKDTKK